MNENRSTQPPLGEGLKACLQFFLLFTAAALVLGWLMSTVR